MTFALKWRLAPLGVLAVILSIPLVQHSWKLHDLSNKAQAAQNLPVSRAALFGEPSRIVVPNAAIDLPVVRGSQDISTKIWSVAPNEANYATITAPANNQNGQTLIYGHNNHKVFAALLGLKTGEKAMVYTRNHHLFVYRYKGSKDVTPDRGDVFDDMKHGTGLVLMTCDGANFEYRHLMTFTLEKAS